MYLLDAQFLDDPSKYFSGVLSALSAMITLEVPHVNVMSKMDLLGDSRKQLEIESFLDPDTDFILSQLDLRTTAKQHGLNQALAR